VFVDRGASQESPFNPQHPITRRLQQVLFMFPGAWQDRNTSDMEFKELASTGRLTGTIRYDDIMQLSRSPVGLSLRNFEVPTGESYVLAVHIRGKAQPESGLASVADDAAATDDDAAKDEPAQEASDAPTETQPQTTAGAASQVADSTDDKPSTSGAEPAGQGDASSGKQEQPSEQNAKKETAEPEMNVVLVSDIDCLASAFFFVREAGEEEAADINWDFDNVAFVLNTLDVLGGDERFVEVRTRRRPHRTLVKVEARTEQARQEASSERQKFLNAFQKAKDEEQKKFDDRIKEIEERKDLDPRTKRVYVETARIDGQRRLETRVASHEQQRNQELRRIERDLSLEVRRVQDRYKLLAILIPPIPPLLVGFFVFFHRRQMEREGVSKSRLR
jgi:ABC-2 type transport system permease protein